MPTASEFDLAATRFTSAAAELAPVEIALRGVFEPDTVSGGILAPSLATCQGLGIAEVLAAIEGLTTAAQTCRVRAEACRAFYSEQATYNRAIRDWRELLASTPEVDLPPRPSAPTKPYDWIE